MRKIVHIIPSLNKGGAERFVVDLCNELSKEQEVYLISLAENYENSFQAEVSSRVNLIILNKKAGLDILVMFQLRKVLNKIRPDVINTHINALEYLLLFLVKFGKRNTLFFHTLHNKADKETANNLILKFRKALYKKMFIVPITISKMMSHSFEEVYKLKGIDKQIDNGRPFVSANMVSVDLIREKFKTVGGKIFVNVARVDKQKNQLNLVKAFNMLISKDVTAKLLIIGDYADQELYGQIQKEIGSSQHIHMLGGVLNVEDYLTACDAFILPSLYEGMPISLIEALSHGCIAICTAVGGVTDMIDDGVNGILASDTSVDGIFYSMQRFMQLENVEQMRRSARESFSNYFDIRSSAANYLKAYGL